MIELQIVAGSVSDVPRMRDSGMFSILDAVIGHEYYEVNVCSAHRNAAELAEFTSAGVAEGARVYIGVAGMAAALPGALAAHTRMARLVIGVPMDEDGIDSCLYMPPGVPVATAGVGRVGLKQAAIMACQVLSIGNDLRLQKLLEYLDSTAKPAQFRIDIKEFKA
ncbi:MAG TPA: AIR carboxylase family protein [Verrucomicrobiae bacterium]|nr:AIR carboxylase family protein [Verrucomicrobiae bacterium]